ncbi:MAG: DoxX-like family protein [Rickettsia aeschlimannii]
MTGIISSIFAYDASMQIIISLGFDKQIAPYILYVSCFTDIILGILLIIKNKINRVCSLQILLILAYTLLLTYLKPILCLDPLGPIFKNIPIILLTLVFMAVFFMRWANKTGDLNATAYTARTTVIANLRFTTL